MTEDLERLWEIAMQHLAEIEDAAERKRRASRGRRAATWGSRV